MAIEFHCHICGKFLRTSDDKAGRTAKCPGCGENVTVPYPEGGFETEDAEGPGQEAASAEGRDEYREPERQTPGGAAPARSQQATKECPMCGETIPAGAARCRFCGEQFVEERHRRIRPGELEFSDVFSASWDIFSNEMGLLIGAVLILTLLTTLVLGVGIAALIGIIVAAASAGDAVLWGVAIAAGVVIYIAFMFFQAYLLAGQNILLLKVVRGQSAEISDLFAGGPYTVRMVVATLIFSSAFTLGYMACLVPGILIALMWWPYSFLIVDRDHAALESLGESKGLTDGNWGQEFLLLLVAMLIQAGANSICPVAFIFTWPWMLVLMAVAYCRLTGQRTVER